MALTTGRLVGGALVLAAAAATLLLPPRPQRLERTGTYARLAARQASTEWRSVRRAVTARVARDAARATPFTDPPVTFAGPWDDGARTWLSDRVVDMLDGQPMPELVRAVVLRDSAFQWSPTLLYALPAQDTDPCVAMLADGWYPEGMRRRLPVYRRAAPALLGPCWYYARFGRPGSAVAEWLAGGGAALALTAPPYPAPGWRPPPAGGWMATALRGPGAWLADQRLEFPLLLESCLSGQEGRCAEFVLGGRAVDRHLRALGFWAEQGWALRTGEITWLNDVLEAFGDERFTVLWTARGDFPTAFEQAFGTTLDAWTRSWARARFGNPGRDVRLAPLTAGVSLAVIGVFVLLAVGIAARRRVA